MSPLRKHAIAASAAFMLLLSGSRSFAAAPVITSALAASADVGAAFSYQITATDSPTSFDALNLPAGLGVDTANGVISGTPASAGTVNVAISAVNADGSGSETLVLTINPAAPAAPVITSALAASGTAGAAFSYQITASNSPTSFNAVNLPAGLGINVNNGVISGTPASPGTVNVAISATNAGGTDTAALVLTIDPAAPVAPNITSNLAASGTAGEAFSYQITASNSPTSFNAVNLPAGLGVNVNNGVISGTPASAGATNVAISATNAGGTDTAALVLTINPAPLLPPVITSALAASVTAGAAFSYQITASNSPTSFNAVNLPAGLGINVNNGVISGTPAAAGTTNVTISATNADGTGAANLVLTTNPVAPVITSALAASATVGAAFSYQITASNSPTSFNAANLPAGFAVNTANGVITGTPAGPGTAGITISATNAGGTTTATLLVSANPAAVIVNASSLDIARVYPNPYTPNGGDDRAGMPFSAGNPFSGIIFDNLPANVTLKIYTLSGRLAAQFGTTAGTGRIQWNVKNEAGRDVASGGYFAVISAPGAKSVIRRLLILR